MESESVKKRLAAARNNPNPSVMLIRDALAVIEQQEQQIAKLNDACNEAWNAFENGKRKHHKDALTGKCIVGCQACAIEKLNGVLNKG